MLNTYKYKILSSITFFLVTTISYSQVYKVKKKKKEYLGGARDYRILSNKGLMLEGGLTYTFDSPNRTYDNKPNFEAQIKPKGGPGFFIGFGLANFNVKKTSSRFGKIYHYFDYGIQFATYKINEVTDLRIYDSIGNLSSPTSDFSNFYKGFLGARFSIHHLFYLGKGGKFIDLAPGIDASYNLLASPVSYLTYTAYNEHFSPNFKAQIHFALGFGFRLKRGSYIIPYAQAPVLGIYEFPNQAIRWFSSSYFPIHIGIKWIRLFEKRKNSCTDNGTEEDRKRNQEYLQGQ